MPRRAVLILTESQFAGLVGAYGRPGLQTPALDTLAAQGIRFDRAYTTCPLCTPARAALFTGAFSHTSGGWGNEVPLGADVRTLGERLRDHGVHAAYVGKWHLSATDYFDTGRAPDGWDPGLWFDGRNYLESLPETLREFSRSPHTPEEIRAAGFTAGHTFAHRCVGRALGFLETHADEDFLLVVSFDEPHAPALAPPPFSGRFRDYQWEIGPAAADTLEGKPAHQRRWADWVRERLRARVSAPGRFSDPHFFACNSYVDHEIGRLLDALDRRAPDALVLFTSDHGEMMGAHQLLGKGPAMYEETVRVPLIVRWPGAAPAGAVCTAPVSQIDLPATLLDFFGAPVPPFLQGRSRLTHFSDPAAAPAETVFIEFNRHSIHNEFYGGFRPIRCAFDGRCKLVLNLFDTDELYDLRTDPAELRNLIASPHHVPHRDRLHAEIIDWMRRTRDPFRGPEWEVRHWHDAPPPPWRSGARHRPDDGYHPPVLEYNTGRPPRPPQS
jgi:uncharacterized sulfatase